MSFLSASSNAAAAAVDITITRPAGAGAAHTLVCLLKRNTIPGGFVAAPVGWTRVAEIEAAGFPGQMTAYTAPGDVAALTFSSPSGNTDFKAATFAFGSRGAVEQAPSAESSGTAIAVPSGAATADADMAMAWVDFQSTASLGATPGGTTETVNDATQTDHFRASYVAGLGAGAVGPYSRTASNFTTKLAIGVRVAAAGGGGGGGVANVIAL